MANVLVIKHGALGDFVMATGAFAAIRAHHAGDRVALLTTTAFADLGRSSNLFDEVLVDERPGFWQLGRVLALRRQLVALGLKRVYDLQTSDRTGMYFRLLPSPKPTWSGIVRGCSHPHATPHRGRLHTIDRLAEQLALAGVGPTPAPDLGWLTADVTRFGLPARYALLVPGGAPHRPAKRWPAYRYAELAAMLLERAIAPVLIGTRSEHEVLDEIRRRKSRVRDLGGQTSLADIAALARGAVFGVGNDTGPMHILAITGCPSVVLFSADQIPPARPRAALP